MTVSSRVRRTVPALLAAGVLTALTAGPLVPAASAASASDRYESDVVKYTNVERAKVKLAVVKPSSCVNTYAERQAKAMAAKKKMYHQSLGPILKSCHLSSVGENVAYGYASGQAVTAAWMGSPGHRANLLGRSYRLIGVGAVQDSSGVWYVSQVFGQAA